MSYYSEAVHAAISEASAAFVNNFCGVAVLALFVYDYLITFDNEVTLFWMPHQFNGALVLFMLNRYLTLTVQILNWIASVPLSFRFHRGTDTLTTLRS
ncbi:hypothetical protein BD309DRAFT_1022465 [Dichomitus squalens]|nr:hypothetical protein BD309DRAFT_1022465 [Dichomitus squalens]